MEPPATRASAKVAVGDRAEGRGRDGRARGGAARARRAAAARHVRDRRPDVNTTPPDDGNPQKTPQRNEPPIPPSWQEPPDRNWPQPREPGPPLTADQIVLKG